MSINFEQYKGRLGRVAVIGTGDLGSEVAKAVVGNGATGLLLTGNRRMIEVRTLAEELRAYVPTVASQLSDLSDRALVEQTLNEAEKQLGGPIEDIVVTVAYQPTTPLQEQTPAEHLEVYRINTVGPYFFAKYALDRAVQLGHQLHVVLVSSDNGLSTEYDPNTPHYDGSKAALNHVASNHLAFAYADGRHQVNVVAPGWINVPSQAKVEGLEAIHRAIAFGRPATAQEVAIGIVHLMKEDHVTGTLRIVANGGGTNRAHLRKRN